MAQALLPDWFAGFNEWLPRGLRMESPRNSSSRQQPHGDRFSGGNSRPIYPAFPVSILVKAGAHFIFRLTRQGIMVFYSLDSERRDASGKVKESPCTSA